MESLRVVIIVFIVGILVGMPDSYYRKVVKDSIGADLGPIGTFGCGIIFTPKSNSAVDAIKEIFRTQTEQRGLKIIGWRKIETGKFHLLFQPWSELTCFVMN